MLRLAKWMVIASVLLATTSCADPFGELCKNTQIAAEKSPDNKHVAIIFKRDCGATTKVSRQLSIYKAKHKLKDSDTGNILTSYGGIAARWEDRKTLTVNWSPDEQYFIKEAEYGDIEIIYK